MFTSKFLLKNAEQYPEEPALSKKNKNGEWETVNWKIFFENTKKIAKSLIACGIEIDEKISIYSYNRKEWYECYLASQLINSVSVGIYHTSSSEEVEWIVENSDSKIIFVGNNPSDNDEPDKMPNHRLFKVLPKLKKLELVVVMDDVDQLEDEKFMSWSDFIKSGESIDDAVVMERNETTKEDGTSCLIYTSGTTGNPKGVELSHNNWQYEVSRTDYFLDYKQGDKYVSWLPLAHVFGQLVDNHVWVKDALHMHVVNNPLEVVDVAKEVKPHLFIGVPRIYEKIYSNIKAAIESKVILKVGLKVPLLSGLLKKKLRDAVGFSNCQYAATGAAPINPEILILFQSLGIPLYEGYGMTENTGVATVNHPKGNKVGTVGKALYGTEVKVDDEGEILIKGSNVMKGYYKNKQSSSVVLNNGWLYTGDVGKIDSDGYLTITGRKKEIYVSSAGKNIAPLVIEETIKSISIISQCFLVGDNKNYCTALITLDVGSILRDKVGLNPNDIPKEPIAQLSLMEEKGHRLSDFTESPKFKSELQSEIELLNKKFSNPEQVKKFAILPRDFTIDDGELTPTLKIRRKQINENWSSVIETLYD